MYIISCHVENFGILSNRSFDFSDGVNTVSDENGRGKSTLAAFLRVMLFGFFGDSKRDELENERKRYKPWQGGVYGGRMTFFANGKKYTVTRTFGAKQAEDEFELRNEETNIISTDYSEKLGEELFKLDSDSFLRTVFISQESHETGVTSGIGAKLGNLAENTDDINNYEKADKAITDLLNKMSPTRATGEIRKLKDEIYALEQNIKSKELTEEAAADIGKRIEELNATQTELKKKQAGLQAERKKAALFTEAGIYEKLKEEEKKRSYDLKTAKSRFSGRIPSSEEVAGVEHRHGQLGEYLKKLEIKENEALSLEKYIAQTKEAADRDFLRAEEECRRFKKEQEEREEFYRKQWEDTRKRRKERIRKNKHIMIFAALAVLAAGICLLFISSAAGLACCGAAAFLAVLAVIVSSKKEKEKLSEQANPYEKHGDNEEIAEKPVKRDEVRDAVIKKDEERLEKLKAETEELKETVSELRAETNGFAAECGEGFAMPEGTAGTDEISYVISQVQLAIMRIKNCETEQKRAEEELRKFEETHDIEAIKSVQGEKPVRTSAQIDTELASIEEQFEDIRRKRSMYEGQLEEKQAKLDEIAENEELLSEKTALRKEKTEKYKALEETKELLQQAKESFTAEFTAPLRNAFIKYYQMIAGSADSSNIMFDANLNLSVLEQGKQREPRFFSAGNRDLLGLCMRFALIDAMYPGEKPFIIADDPLTNFDDKRLAGGREFLKKAGLQYQIIYMTCCDERRV